MDSQCPGWQTNWGEQKKEDIKDTKGIRFKKKNVRVNFSFESAIPTPLISVNCNVLLLLVHLTHSQIILTTV